MLLQQNNKCPVEDLNFIRYYITNIYYLCIIVGGDRKEPNMAAAARRLMVIFYIETIRYSDPGHIRQ
jgi:hypothetical protein